MSHRDLDQYLKQLDELYIAVQCYLSNLDAVAQGAQPDMGEVDHWLDELRSLTS